MQFYVFNICPKLHHWKWRKLPVTLPVNMAPFSEEDKILIKSLYEYKGYKARQFITEFPDNVWTKNCINRLPVKLRKFGTVDRQRQTTQCEYWWNMHALFLAWSLRDDSVTTSTPTWKLKHTDSILEHFEYFCQMSSKSILMIFSYTVSKLVRFFWDTV